MSAVKVTAEAKFARLQEQYREACKRELQYRQTVLYPRYREFRPSTSWLTMTERKRLDSFSSRIASVSDSSRCWTTSADVGSVVAVRTTGRWNR